MLTFEFSMNIVMLSALVAIAVYIGFRFRSMQIKKSRWQVASLEREMINNHAEILELQKENLDLEIKFQALLNAAAASKATKSSGAEKLSETLRKKLSNKNGMGSSIDEGYNLNYSTLINKDARVASSQY